MIAAIVVWTSILILALVLAENEWYFTSWYLFLIIGVIFPESILGKIVGATVATYLLWELVGAVDYISYPW